MTVSAFDPYTFEESIPDTHYSKAFQSMMTLIQDEIDDTTDEYSPQIQDSIISALRMCKRELFFFNTKEKISFKIQKGKQWYGKEDNIFIEPDMVIEALFLKTNSEKQQALSYKSMEELEEEERLQEKYGLRASREYHDSYTFLNQKIGIFPIPQKDGVAWLYCVPRLVEGATMQKDDIWFFCAFDLIKARAKYELYKNILKDPEYAAVSYNDFQEQLQLLRYETSRLRGCGNILPTGF
ncbi:hypothetical protein [Bartonella sp. A05]|uniref:hypothetical protein n=1 Tax=Bartonella sp. A05 TaxID=2967261 RepID=UPI0022A8DFF1|nr:hypothetical protein [Bartonella sp. A05]